MTTMCKRKIIPYIPPWKAPGTHSVFFETVNFTDRCGNRATVKTAYYKDSKGKDRECVACVKWEDL